MLAGRVHDDGRGPNTEPSGFRGLEVGDGLEEPGDGRRHHAELGGGPVRPNHRVRLAGPAAPEAEYAGVGSAQHGLQDVGQDPAHHGALEGSAGKWSGIR